MPYFALVQPPRSGRIEVAWACVVLAFLPAVGVDWPGYLFDLHYPTWMRWIADILWAIFFATLATFLVLRSREVVSYRRQHSGKARSPADR